MSPAEVVYDCLYVPECECQNHATRCHFDPAIYEITERVSGGVCDDCQHNTRGRNCEECKPFFYQDAGREPRDPNICQRMCSVLVVVERPCLL